jgi:hypothetical protein
VATSTTSHSAVSELEEHLALSVDRLQLVNARKDFLHFGFVKIPFMVPQSVKGKLGEEVEQLVAEHGIRRDYVFKETGNTPRNMCNVRRKEIFGHGRVVPELYGSTALRAALSEVAGEEVLECPYEPEQCVVTELGATGDTHGWHWDDYSFALVWVITCPPIEQGGFVQCVPRTVWNKSDPQLNRQFVNNPTYSLELFPGDLYFMRTDTTLHRVYPIESGRRLIVNMGYAARRDLAKAITHETMDNLWADA